MASVPVENVVMAELLMTLGGETIENTLYFDKVTPVVAADLVTLGEMLVAWWEGGLRNQLSNGCVLVAIELTDLTGPTGPATTFTAGLPLGGTNAGEPMSNNVAPAISFHTNSRGRSFRGRNYISGIPEAGVAGNIVQAVVITAIAAAYNSLIADAIAAGFVWVVVSRYSGIDPSTGKPIPRAAGIPTAIQSASFKDSVVDSQRRRLPNH